MSKSNFIRGIALLTAVLVLTAGAMQASQGRGGGAAAKKDAPAAKPTPNTRFGRWKMDSTNPAPQSNIMTYEPWGDGGMKVTVTTVSAQGQSSAWSYETLFDGKFHTVTGQTNAETAVEFINDKSTRIQNKRADGQVYQVVINTLSDDLKTINNEYVRLDENGKITGVTHAVYRKIE